MKHTFKHILLSGLLVVSSVVLTGCFEIYYKDLETYYEAFDNNVKLINTDEMGLVSELHEEELEKLFNDDTVNDIHSVETVESKYYEYLCVKSSNEMDLGQMALYMQSDSLTTMKIRIYIKKYAPEINIRSFMLPDKNITGGLIDYEDRFNGMAAEVDVDVSNDEWTAFYIEEWHSPLDYKETSSSINVAKDSYIIVQFLNNTGYGSDLRLKTTKFTFTNLMISPRNEKNDPNPGIKS